MLHMLALYDSEMVLNFMLNFYLLECSCNQVFVNAIDASILSYNGTRRELN
jgi:hypothetical protein